MIGSIRPPRTLILRLFVGTAEDPKTGKDAYEMTAAVTDMSPIVRSIKSGKWFTLDWQAIVALARRAGIDFEGEPECPQAFRCPECGGSKTYYDTTGFWNGTEFELSDLPTKPEVGCFDCDDAREAEGDA